jgi:hypothetical protein
MVLLVLTIPICLGYSNIVGKIFTNGKGVSILRVLVILAFMVLYVDVYLVQNYR